ncbi:hypothetical protein NDU88_006700 [Pleurodeles waltl]|uniref:Uncharacterized protein n=1 Tax=Pleurodeles waltl TaxID=8319 RepID=A0AAV7RMZ8_PLEWA|nr:hypothetical protein NDU88_006700 [Pleurodeles waltl]
MVVKWGLPDPYPLALPWFSWPPLRPSRHSALSGKDLLSGGRKAHAMCRFQTQRGHTTRRRVAARRPKPPASPSSASCCPRSQATAPPRCPGCSAMSAGPMGTPLRPPPPIPG